MGGAHLPVAFQFAGGGGIVLGQRQRALESRGSGARRLRIGIVGIQGSLTVLEITCEGGLVGLLITLVGEAGIGSRGAVHADPVGWQPVDANLSGCIRCGIDSRTCRWLFKCRSWANSLDYGVASGDKSWS